MWAGAYAGYCEGGQGACCVQDLRVYRSDAHYAECRHSEEEQFSRVQFGEHMVTYVVFYYINNCFVDKFQAIS